MCLCATKLTSWSSSTPPSLSLIVPLPRLHQTEYQTRLSAVSEQFAAFRNTATLEREQLKATVDALTAAAAAAAPQPDDGSSADLASSAASLQSQHVHVTDAALRNGVATLQERVREVCTVLLPAVRSSTADALADTQQHHAASLLALQVRAGGGDG